jgi:fatty-acid desaturase
MPLIIKRKPLGKLATYPKIGEVDLFYMGLSLLGLVLFVFAIWLIPLSVLIAILLVYTISALGIAFWKYYGL